MFTGENYELLKQAFAVYYDEYFATLPGQETLSLITFTPAFKKRMEKLIRRQNHPWHQLVNTAAKRVACAVLAVLFTAALTTAFTVGSMESFREPKPQFVTKVFPTHTQVWVDYQPYVPPETVETVLPAYIPDSFDTMTEYRYEMNYEVEYTNDAGQLLRFEQSIYDGIGMHINTESSPHERLEINGMDAIWFECFDRMHVLFLDEQYLYEVSIPGELGRDELMKIAESVPAK